MNENEVLVNMGGIVNISLPDYTGKVSTVIFLRGCPLNCVYCHNYELRNGVDLVDSNVIKAMISDAEDFIDAVVFSGGEPCMQEKALHDLMSFCKQNDLLTGIETCGYKPDTLINLDKKKLIDRVYLDVKAPLNNDELYEKVTRVASIANSVKKVLEYSLKSNFELIVRIPNDSKNAGKEEIKEIIEQIKKYECEFTTHEITDVKRPKED